MLKIPIIISILIPNCFLKATIDSSGLTRLDLVKDSSRSRFNSTSSTGGPNSPEETNSNSDDDDESEKSEPKLKAFFKNLIGLSGFRKATSSNPNLSKQRDTSKTNHTIKSEYIASDESNRISPRGLSSRFWSLDRSKIELAFEEYRKSAGFVSGPNDFREIFRKAIDSANFDNIGDFYNWTFSNSANMIELFISDKAMLNEKSTGDKKKHFDPCYYVSMNWRFLKEIYNCLVKMVLEENKG